MDKTLEIMIALLCYEVFGIQLREELFLCTESAYMKEVVALSEQHDLSHIVVKAARQCGFPMETSTQKKGHTNILMAIWRYERMQREQLRILSALEEARIDHMLLKGDMVRRYYPEPWMRTSCDIDVLVHREDLERAERVLTETLRYKSEGKHYHDVSLRSENGVHLELHFSLNVHNALADQKLASVWQNTLRVDGCAHRYEMEPTFFLFYFIAHMAGHFLRGGCGVRSVLDLFLLERNLPYDEHTLETLLGESELRRFYNGMHQLGCSWFSEDGDRAWSAVGEYVLTGGVYGTSESRIAIARGQTGGEVKYWFHRLFQPKELLQGTYPQLEKRPYLYPYYQVKRWFRFLKPDTRKRIVREAKYGHGMAEHHVASTEELLECLGLDKH